MSIFPRNEEAWQVPGIEAPGWATPLPIDHKSQARAVAGMKKMRDHLPGNAFLIIRIGRINKPPRSINAEVHLVETRKDGPVIIPTNTVPALLNIMIGQCSDLIKIAIDLLKRWPEGSSPETIGIITDGHIAIFNPGKPEANNYDWVKHHLNGTSPCISIAGHSETPLGIKQLTEPKFQRKNK